MAVTIHPAIETLIAYAAAAPATDPGEGYWESCESAFGCGERAAQFVAAERIRAALKASGLDAPAGVKLCPGCSRDDDGFGHDPDCTIGEAA